MPRMLQRPDDKEEVIGKRLEVYEAQTKPLIKYYEAAGLLRVVDADADVETVFKSIRARGARRPLARLPPAIFPDFLAPPAREGLRIALSHRQRLDFAARRENFRTGRQVPPRAHRPIWRAVRSPLFAPAWGASPDLA